jgi:hypothetical protein
MERPVSRRGLLQASQRQDADERLRVYAWSDGQGRSWYFAAVNSVAALAMMRRRIRR